MSNTKRRSVARRQAWGRGPHLLPFLRPADAAAQIAPEPTGVFYQFPEGRKVERPILDQPGPDRPDTPFGIIAADGTRTETLHRPAPIATVPALRLHDAMTN